MNIRKISVTMIAAVFSILSVGGRQPIVPDFIKEEKEFFLASRFLERYQSLLQRSSIESVSDSLRMVKEQGFTYIHGSDSRMKRLEGDEEFSISLDDGMYSAIWSRDGATVVECAFPARIDLLKFSNKIQLEDTLIKYLEGWQPMKQPVGVPTMSVSKLNKVEYSPFYVMDGGYYITPRLNHQVVYHPSDSVPDKCELLVGSSLYPLECISNYMLTGYSPSPIALSLDIDRYGYQSKTIPISLADLFHALTDEGSEPYWGVDEYDGNIIKGLYVWLNKPGGFAHVISMDIPMVSLTSASEAKAKMHAYIRLDNLKTLFEEFK